MPDLFPAMKALVQDGDKFLILKQVINDQNFWDLPGGKIEHGEDPYHTLHREVKEETGLEIQIMRPFGMWWFFTQKGNNQIVCSTFLCRPTHTTVDLSQNPADEPIQEYQWVTKEEFLSDDYRASHDSLKILIARL